MDTKFEIYTVKEVTFEQGKIDPFGFDDYIEKLGSKYLPFSGTAAKPSYILFTSYVNQLLKKKLIPYKNPKERGEIKIKLEKLLVYSWKSRTKESLRGKGVIGNSFKLTDIDPFSSKGWVKQNCFRIYTENNFKAEKTLDRYMKSVGNKQIDLIKDFLSRSYVREKDKVKYLSELIKSLGKSKDSLFSYHLLSDKFKKIFKRELREEIRDKTRKESHDEYFKIVNHFFENNKFNESLFWKKTLDNKNLPFMYLNFWFGKIIEAVEADLNNKGVNKFWKSTDNAYSKIPKKYNTLEMRPNRGSWFDYYNGKYHKTKDFNRFFAQWDSYKLRQGEEVKKYFTTFRHYALARLLKELIV